MRRTNVVIFCLWLLCLYADGQKKQASKKVKKPTTGTTLCKKADINQLSSLFTSLLRNEVADMRNDMTGLQSEVSNKLNDVQSDVSNKLNDVQSDVSNKLNDVQSELSHMHDANMDVRDELFELKEKIAALAHGGRNENISMPDTPCNMSFPNHQAIENWIKEAVEDQMNSLLQAISSKLDTQPKDKQVSGISTGSCSGEKDGIFTIQTRNNESFVAKCDKGWLVLAHRYDGSVDFNRDWQDYKNGFGNLTGEFFIGMDKIVALTNSENYTVRFELTTWENETRSSDYSSFKVASETDNYRLTIGGYEGGPGTAGDGMTIFNGRPFSTKDKDNDIYVESCARLRRGSWWYSSCGYTNLFAFYMDNPRCDIMFSCVTWQKWPETLYEENNGYYSFKAFKIMVRASTDVKR